jgi:hypothetical protein
MKAGIGFVLKYELKARLGHYQTNPFAKPQF